MKYSATIALIFILFGNQLIADSKAISATNSAQKIIDVLEHKTFERHITTDMFNIARNGHLLSDEIKKELESFGFDFSGSKVVMKSLLMQDYYDTERFRIHYDISGFNAVDPADSDGDNIPDYIETMAEVFEEVYDHEINVLGYTPPPTDGEHGGSGNYDVFIKKLSYYGLTNYIEPAIGDNPNSLEKENNAYASYLNMNSSYDGTSFAHNTELENIQVTAAHEFFHAIQLGYDGDEEHWLLESTAVWMEEENYDDVNDCYQYMIPWFEEPHKTLTQNYTLHPYGSFIFFKYIDEHLGGKEIIKSLWENSRNYNSNDDDYSVQIVDLALKDKGHSFKKALNNMIIANCILSSEANTGIYSYEEAQGYNEYFEISYGDTFDIELGILDTIQFNKDDFTTIYSNRLLQPYASQYVKVNTDVPVRISLRESSTNETPIDGLSLHSIVKTLNGNYDINSGTIINIDPSFNTDWIYIAVVSNEENPNSYFNYELVASNGISENITQFTISNYYPNPFNNATNVKIKVTTPQKIDVIVFDILGRKIKTISNGFLSDGSHEFIWDGTTNNGNGVSSGVYYIVADGANHQEWKKVTLVK